MKFRILRLVVSAELTSWSDPFWSTTSDGGSRTYHLVGLFYEWNASVTTHVLGFIIGPILLRLGYIVKRKENL